MIKSGEGSNKVCLDDFLLEVRKPARYIGNEFNCVEKYIEDSGIHFSLCFPDSYEIGMSHLGMKVLYDILNKQDDLCCDRCFTPWPDMEEKMRSRGIGLFSVTSRINFVVFPSEWNQKNCDCLSEVRTSFAILM